MPQIKPPGEKINRPVSREKTNVIDIAKNGYRRMPTIDELNINSALDESHSLTPSFFVFSHGEMEQFIIPKLESIFKIGNADHCDITLEDHMISCEQVAVVKLGGMCYFMDCGTHDCVYFNGIKERQACIPADNRMVMKIGNTWVVYIGIDSQDYADTGDSMLVKKAMTAGSDLQYKPQGELVIDSLFGEWLTHSSPILIGSHISCDYKMYGKEVKPFHALIYFTPSGAFVEDLTHGKPGIIVEGLHTIGISPINQDMTIQIDETPIQIKIYGDILLRCDFLFEDLETKPNLVLTQLNCEDATPIPLSLQHEGMSIGRSENCTICVQDPSISKTHAFLYASDKHLKIQDCESENFTYVNLKQVHKGSVHPGDIIGLGETFFLLHYQ